MSYLTVLVMSVLFNFVRYVEGGATDALPTTKSYFMRGNKTLRGKLVFIKRLRI